MDEIIKAHVLLAPGVVYIKAPEAVMVPRNIRDKIRAARGYADAHVEINSLFNETVVNARRKYTAHSAAGVNYTCHYPTSGIH